MSTIWLQLNPLRAYCCSSLTVSNQLQNVLYMKIESTNQNQLCHHTWRCTLPFVPHCQRTARKPAIKIREYFGWAGVVRSGSLGISWLEVRSWLSKTTRHVTDVILTKNLSNEHSKRISWLVMNRWILRGWFSIARAFTHWNLGHIICTSCMSRLAGHLAGT